MPPEAIEIDRMPTSPCEVAKAMRTATLNICMRYHSVVFAEELGAHYVAIDYTGGGKIANYLADIGKAGSALPIAGGASADRL